jgi:hypothetical protein
MSSEFRELCNKTARNEGAGKEERNIHLEKYKTFNRRFQP